MVYYSRSRRIYLRPTIKEYLQTVPEDVSSVGVVWKRFGSSGHIEQPDKIIPNFTWPRDVSKVQYYEELKTIVKGEKFVATESLHNCALKDGKTISYTKQSLRKRIYRRTNESL